MARGVGERETVGGDGPAAPRQLADRHHAADPGPVQRDEHALGTDPRDPRRVGGRRVRRGQLGQPQGLAHLVLGLARRPGSGVDVGAQREQRLGRGVVRGLAATGQEGVDDPVHDEVRVAPDRAGEVQVAGAGQAEVRPGGRRVGGPAEEAEQHVPDGAGRVVGGGVELGRQRGQVQGRQVAAEARVVAGGGAERLQRRGRLGAGRGVHPEDAGQAPVDQPAGDGLVGGDHQALDEQVGRVRRRGRHLRRLALHDLDRQVGLDATGLDAASAQSLHPEARPGGPQPAQRVEHLGGDAVGGRAGEGGGCYLVRQPGVGADP